MRALICHKKQQAVVTGDQVSIIEDASIHKLIRSWNQATVRSYAGNDEPSR